MHPQVAAYLTGGLLVSSSLVLHPLTSVITHASALAGTRAIFSSDGVSRVSHAEPCGYCMGFTNHNLHISSSVRYLDNARGMSLINVESLGYASYWSTYH